MTEGEIQVCSYFDVFQCGIDQKPRLSDSGISKNQDSLVLTFHDQIEDRLMVSPDQQVTWFPTAGIDHVELDRSSNKLNLSVFITKSQLLRVQFSYLRGQLPTPSIRGAKSEIGKTNNEVAELWGTCEEMKSKYSQMVYTRTRITFHLLSTDF